MKTSFRFVVPIGLALLAVTGLFLLSCSKDDDGGGDNAGAQWTIMMYGAGNNNLDVSNNNTSFIIQDAQDMEKVGSQSGMNILAMVASERTGGLAKYYHIEYYPSENPDALSSTILADKGTKDMSDPATLREFINYCKANYPAQKYLLVIDDHGAGWPGSCSDELNGGGGLLTMIELKNAIAQSDLQHVDIVTFHACLMAMVEVGYELRNVASYMTASQFTMPMQNVLGADLWLAWLRNNTGATPAQLAQKIAEQVRVATENKQKTSHYAMVDLSQMQSLGAQLGTFGNTLVTEAAEHWDEVQAAWSGTHSTAYDNDTYVDIREFCNKIKAQPTLSTINMINSGANNLISAMNSAVPYTACYFYPPDVAVPRGGLNVHFPYQFEQFDSANYVALEFHATNWHSFLSTFLRATGGTQPTNGRCCYNNNQSCAVNTQAACTQLGGTWTQGIDCNTPCTTTGTCASTCATATTISVGTTITSCSFSSSVTENWFYVTLSPGTYRFQLYNFPSGSSDYDCYTFLQCSDYPNSPTTCSSSETGTEDFTCTVSSGSVSVYILIYAYAAPYGSYTFSLTQTGARPEDNNAPAIAFE